MIEGNFGDMDRLLGDRGVQTVDGVALDLGVSSMQLDRAERGFSFRADGPLDMRMSHSGESAADLVNRLDEADLANLIYDLGEERLSRRIAAAIVRARPITRTAELAQVIRRVMPPKGDGIDPATRTFQALRIAVNDELGELTRGLSAAEHLLASGGRLAVVTFHSLEDRPVKTFFQRRAGKTPGGSRHLPTTAPSRAPSFRLLSNKPLVADKEEVRINPRARSAKLRAAERTAAPPWPKTLDLGEAA
jgi:16S rRNA (cytosine1402-N4)-methyltransferase